MRLFTHNKYHICSGFDSSMLLQKKETAEIYALFNSSVFPLNKSILTLKHYSYTL